MKFIKLIGAAVAWALTLFNRKTEGTKPDVASNTIDQVISVVDHIKSIVDSPIVVTLTALIPGNLDNALREALSRVLPAIITGLTYTKQVHDAGDEYNALQAGFARLRLSEDPDKNAFYHALAARLIEAASDGKVTWSEAVSVAEYYFKNVYSKQV